MVRVVGGKCGVVCAFCVAGVVFYGGVVWGVCGDFGVGVFEVEENDGVGVIKVSPYRAY